MLEKITVIPLHCVELDSSTKVKSGYEFCRTYTCAEAIYIWPAVRQLGRSTGTSTADSLKMRRTDFSKTRRFPMSSVKCGSYIDLYLQ